MKKSEKVSWKTLLSDSLAQPTTNTSCIYDSQTFTQEETITTISSISPATKSFKLQVVVIFFGLSFFCSLSFSHFYLSLPPSAPAFCPSLHLSLSRGNLPLFFACLGFSWVRQQMEGCVFFFFFLYVNICMGVCGGLQCCGSPPPLALCWSGNVSVILCSRDWETSLVSVWVQVKTVM